MNAFLFPPHKARMTVKERKKVNECFECAISVKIEIKDISLKSILKGANKREDALISASNVKKETDLLSVSSEG